MLNRLVCVVAIMAAAFSVTACGGSSPLTATTGTKTTTTPTTTGTTTATTTTTPVTPPVSVLTETVRNLSPVGNFGPSINVSPGQAVDFRTSLPPAHGSAPTKVTLDLATGPGATLTVTATAGHRSAQATLTGAGHKPLTLVSALYACLLPPAVSFCPATGSTMSKGHETVTFSALPSAPIDLTATVGPIANPPVHKAVPVRTAVVPPYFTIEKVSSISVQSLKAGKSAPPSSTAIAAPGDRVTMITYLAGKRAGAPQRVTVTFDRRPSTSITVSASVPGGKASTATIKASGGKSIALGVPHFSCFLPPNPTFCPATAVKAGSRRYKVTFSASPSTPPIVIRATIPVA